MMLAGAAACALCLPLAQGLKVASDDPAHKIFRHTDSMMMLSRTSSLRVNAAVLNGERMENMQTIQEETAPLLDGVHWDSADGSPAAFLARLENAQVMFDQGRWAAPELMKKFRDRSDTAAAVADYLADRKTAFQKALAQRESREKFNHFAKSRAKSVSLESAEEKKQDEFSVYFASWNIAGLRDGKYDHIPEDQLHELLLPKEAGVAMSDFYVCSFQELVPLDPKHIFFESEKKDQIRKNVNGQIAHFLSNVRDQQEYVLVGQSSETGQHTAIFARADLESSIVKVKTDKVLLGDYLGGNLELGNKAAVGLKVTFKMGAEEKTGVFVNMHLAAHRGEKKQEHRDAMLKKVFAELFNENENKTAESSIFHDVSFAVLMGDFNCHMVMDMDYNKSDKATREDVMNHIKVGRAAPANSAQVYNSILSKSDLFTNGELGWKSDQSPLRDLFGEAPVSFEPTFKYDIKHGPENFDYKKDRVPSWLDRMFFSGKTIRVEEYKSPKCNFSDHRPIVARMVLSANQVDLEDRGFKTVVKVGDRVQQPSAGNRAGTITGSRRDEWAVRFNGADEIFVPKAEIYRFEQGIAVGDRVRAIRCSQYHPELDGKLGIVVQAHPNKLGKWIVKFAHLEMPQSFEQANLELAEDRREVVPL